MSDAKPIEYIARTRAYYRALGYGAPYQWAQVDDVPFVRLSKPLSQAKIALITTAAPYKPGAGDQGPGAPYNADAKFYQVYRLPADPAPDLRNVHVAIDRAHTTGEDPGTWFPLAALQRAAAQGRIETLTDNIFGLPTNRSHRTTVETDCPALVAAVQASDADAAIFVPNCPVCHQSVSLAACALEAAGTPTVIMGAALDIVAHVGTPRFWFSDFPLGNSAGRPGDPASQDFTLLSALELLETATEPRTVARSPLQWPGPSDWRDDYSNPAKLSPEEIARRRAEFDKGKAAARALRGK